MRSLPVLRTNLSRRTVMRVTETAHLINEWTPDLNFLVVAGPGEDIKDIERLNLAGLSNLTFVTTPVGRASPQVQSSLPTLCVSDIRTLEPGDVVVISPQDRRLNVLLRESDVHHALFLTNRCNNNCLMCSQPPTRQDDAWLLEEAFEVLCHVRNAPAKLGITGGEPLLYGQSLRRLFDMAGQRLPATQLELLTNGRLLADSTLAKTLLEDLKPEVSWLVPLYGHADFLHDFVVQTSWAFDETLAALLNLQSYGQAIQLRIVLIKPVLEILPALCEFIGRNLPFVREVALMACEPTGFALANRAQCDIDLRAQMPILQNGIRMLERLGVPYVLMNIPLCALPESLWPAAAQSISDWKQAYAPACADCVHKTQCCGLFAWHDKTWTPAPITTITEEVIA